VAVLQAKKAAAMLLEKEAKEKEKAKNRPARAEGTGDDEGTDHEEMLDEGRVVKRAPRTAHMEPEELMNLTSMGRMRRNH
jgi:hypothetical protein